MSSAADDGAAAAPPKRRVMLDEEDDDAHVDSVTAAVADDDAEGGSDNEEVVRRPVASAATRKRAFIEEEASISGDEDDDRDEDDEEDFDSDIAEFIDDTVESRVKQPRKKRKRVIAPEEREKQLLEKQREAAAELGELEDKSDDNIEGEEEEEEDEDIIEDDEDEYAARYRELFGDPEEYAFEEGEMGEDEEGALEEAEGAEDEDEELMNEDEEDEEGAARAKTRPKTSKRADALASRIPERLSAAGLKEDTQMDEEELRDFRQWLIARYAYELGGDINDESPHRLRHPLNVSAADLDDLARLDRIINKKLDYPEDSPIIAHLGEYLAFSAARKKALAMLGNVSPTLEADLSHVQSVLVEAVTAEDLSDWEAWVSFLASYNAETDSSYRAFANSVPNIADDYLSAFPEHPLPALTVAPRDFPGLERARALLRKHIALIPYIRKDVREHVFSHGSVNTKPTPAALQQIARKGHELYPVHHLVGKPIAQFMAPGMEEFLLIAKGVKDGQLEVEIDCNLEPIVQKVIHVFSVDLLDAVNSEWNRVREEIVRQALRLHVLPLIRSQFIAVLHKRAKFWFLQRCRNTLYDIVSLGPPYVPTRPNPKQLDVHKHSRLFRVLAIAPHTQTAAACIAVLNEAGEVLESRTVNNPSNIGQEIFDLSGKYVPDVYVISPERGELLTELEDFTVKSSTKGSVTMFIVEPWVGSIVAKNNNAAKAVALGRFVQDPLEALSLLFGSETDKLYRFMPLARLLITNGCRKVPGTLYNVPIHEFVPEPELYHALADVFRSCIHFTGIDPHRLYAHHWVSPIVQFIPGFGPATARAFCEQYFEASTEITERRELKDFDISPAQFESCAAYFRISAQNYLYGLEATFIHPRDYGLAALISAGKTVAWTDWEVAHPHEIQAEKYATQLREELKRHTNAEKVLGNESKLDQLAVNCQVPAERVRAVCQELIRQFRDDRDGLQSLSYIEAFWLSTREHPLKLFEGAHLQVYVERVKREFSESRNQQGSRRCGYGHLMGSSTAARVELQQGEEVAPHEVVKCSVVRIEDKEQVVVCELVRDSGHSNAYSGMNMPYNSLVDVASWELCEKPNETYLKPIDVDQRERERLASAQRAKLITRSIVHTFFQNVTGPEAYQQLNDAPPGTCIFRPSRKSVDFLTLTIRYVGGHKPLYLDYDIKENEKPRNNPTAIGARLQLLRRDGSVLAEFSDLDELYAEFVEPLAANMNAVAQHPKFDDCYTAQDAYELLAQRKLQLQAHSQNMPSIPYCLSLDYDHPPRCIIYFLPSTTVHPAYFTITEAGFRFNEKVFKSLDEVIGQFKEELARKVMAVRRGY